MSVIAARELTGRTFSHRFGEAPSAQRRFSVTLDHPATTNQEILNYIGIFHGALHPEYLFLLCVEGSVTENTPTPYHAEVVYRYEAPKLGTKEFQPNPLARPDIWSFSPTAASVPALNYFDGNGNDTVKALTNTAGDYFEGLMVESSEVRCVIAGNRAAYPAAIANQVTNTINNAVFLGCDPHTWKCQGIGAQQKTEVVNEVEISYWEVTVELLYRPQTWLLKLPNVGFNYLPGGYGDKAPVHVKDNASGSATYGQDVPSQVPLALESNGDLRTSGDPDILERRPYATSDFSSYFGTPPF